MEKMKIEIWSDITCPYCYIGKRKLEKALAQFPHANEIDLIWHSYELNPALPKQALNIPFVEYFSQSHDMTIEQVKKNNEKVTALAKEEGLNYDFEHLVVANTSDALRLVKLAKKHHLADDAEEVLFKAYFEQGKDVSDRNVLIALGTQIGLDEKEIVTMLDSNEFIDEIANDIRYSEDELELEYIPFYRINNKDIVQGSLPVEEYLKAVSKAYEEWKAGSVSSAKGSRTKGGASCSSDGVCSLD